MINDIVEYVAGFGVKKKRLMRPNGLYYKKKKITNTYINFINALSSLTYV